MSKYDQTERKFDVPHDQLTRVLYDGETRFTGTPDEAEAWLVAEHERATNPCKQCILKHHHDYVHTVRYEELDYSGQPLTYEEDGRSFRVRQHLWRIAGELHRLSLLDSSYTGDAWRYHDAARTFESEGQG